MPGERSCRLHIGPRQVFGQIDRGAADAGVQDGIRLKADLLCARLQLDVGNVGGNTCREVLTALGGGPSGRGKARYEK